MTERRREADEAIARIRQDMDEMKQAMAELQKEVAGLLEAWNTATGLVKFIKWVATLVAAGGVIWAFLNGFFSK